MSVFLLRGDQRLEVFFDVREAGCEDVGANEVEKVIEGGVGRIGGEAFEIAVVVAAARAVATEIFPGWIVLGIARGESGEE